ncbi:MAG: cardiolipin synthase [Planctomycetota bacterium]|jgi:cardiolipin synthase
MDSGFWTLLVLSGELLLRLSLVAVMLIRGRGKPSSRLTWIVVIMAVPLIGMVLYLMVGEVRLGTRRAARHRALVERLDRISPAPETWRPVPPPVIPANYRQIAFLARAVGGLDPLGGNDLRLLSDTSEFIASLVEDIDAATDHCHLLYYIYLDDGNGRTVADALTRAAARGVACRLLVDSVGSSDFTESNLRSDLEAAGVQVVEALPANPLRMLFHRIDLRNHRKIAVIDGCVGYTGSHNIADESFALKPKYAPWVDTSVRAMGPITHDLQMLFVQDWYLDTDESLESVLTIRPPAADDDMVAQIMGTGPDYFGEALRQLCLAAFHGAHEELILTTPYFVPDEATAMALRTAARRGVAVSLVVPARNDSRLVGAASRSHYESLLGAGVRILEFESGLLHAKTISVDRDFALVTTANLDRRSFELNYEVSLVVYDTDFASRLRFLQQSYIAAARPIEPGPWSRRHWPARLWQNAAGTLSPLL